MPGVAVLSREDTMSYAGASTVEGVGSQDIGDEWRRWIAEHLMLEVAPDDLYQAMVACGIAPETATFEINRALQSPYFQGSEHVRNRLKKREWLLATYRKLNRMHPRSTAVERRSRPTREEFLVDYYSANRPVIITGMMDDWPALERWSLDDFADRLGDRMIEVQMGRNADPNYEIEQTRHVSRMKFADYLAMVRGAGVTNDFYMTANNNSHNKTALAELWDDIVQVPEYLDTSDRLGGFFWLGPAGTVTPYHHDLTNNFMAQVIGSKRVRIAPSWDIPLMKNNLHVYSKLDGRTLPPAPEPGPEQPQILECILGPGEILFLPIGCMHYVEGISISATVSFTNFVFDNDFHSFYSTYHAV
jgi:hypothetical protein